MAAEPGALAGGEMYLYGCHWDVRLLSGPIMPLGPYLLIFADVPLAPTSADLPIHPMRVW